MLWRAILMHRSRRRRKKVLGRDCHPKCDRLYASNGRGRVISAVRIRPSADIGADLSLCRRHNGNAERTHWSSSSQTLRSCALDFVPLKEHRPANSASRDSLDRQGIWRAKQSRSERATRSGESGVPRRDNTGFRRSPVGRFLPVCHVVRESPLIADIVEKAVKYSL
jgi:hypothetical protein